MLWISKHVFYVFTFIFHVDCWPKSGNQVHQAEPDNLSNLGKLTTRIAILGVSLFSKVNVSLLLSY